MKNSRLIVLIMCLIFVFSTTAYAHKMTIEEVEDGLIQVLYDDGSFSTRTEVTVYNSNDEVIESGKLDDEGRFTYNPNEDVSYIVADDGMGHMHRWEVGEETSGDSASSKFIKIGIVVAALVGVAGFSYNKRRKND